MKIKDNAVEDIYDKASELKQKEDAKSRLYAMKLFKFLYVSVERLLKLSEKEENIKALKRAKEDLKKEMDFKIYKNSRTKLD
ncbi:MAG: hypothetical protein ACOC56_04665 [Atribacterota bacterium]